MNKNVLKISVILISCVLLAGFAAASNTTDSKSDAKDVSALAKPNITSINPTSGKVGETVDFTITGANFSKSSKVYLENESDREAKNINAKDVTSNSTTTLTGSFDIPSGADTGSWIVNVKDNGQTSASKVKFIINK
jgi:hypothetical protein